MTLGILARVAICYGRFRLLAAENAGFTYRHLLVPDYSTNQTNSP